MTAEGALEDEVAGAVHFKANPFAEQFGVVPEPERVKRPMRDAVAVEEPFPGLGRMKQLADSFHRAETIGDAAARVKGEVRGGGRWL
jgi:hypothetical protein